MPPGMMVGYSLARLHFAGFSWGYCSWWRGFLRTRDFASFTTAAALCIVLMVILTGGVAIHGQQPHGTA